MSTLKVTPIVIVAGKPHEISDPRARLQALADSTESFRLSLNRLESFLNRNKEKRNVSTKQSRPNQ